MGILRTLSGMQVAVDRPVKAGAVAHRPRYFLAEIPHRQYANQTEKRGVVGPACQPTSVKGIPAVPCAELSAGWAHEIGSVPCAAPECFGGQV